MSSQTPYFDLYKPASTDSADIEQIAENFDTIDTEMHKPPLSVNQQEPDANRNIQITTVPLADNLTSDTAQLILGTFTIRASGGDAAISNGAAMLSDIRGNMVKTGYVPQVVEMTVSPAERGDGVVPITATIDDAAFLQAASSSSGTMTFSYTSAWDTDPSNYGITVSGTPISGDSISVTYNKGNRGTISAANPSTFISTGWNLYNHTAGYCRLPKYSEEYGYMIDGTYTSVEFSETLSGTKEEIEPVNGHFDIPSDGYLWIEGGNTTDTAVWPTWSDWTEQANGGVFQAYTQTTVDISGVMVNFPSGLMKVGNVYDEINFNTKKAYSRIEKLEYTTSNLETVIARGLPYDTDTGYIYAVRTSVVSYDISLSGSYTANGHGTEIFLGAAVPVTASCLYGQDLKDKLKRDVVTISQQTLSEAQKNQVLTNIGAPKASRVTTLETNLTDLFIIKNYSATVSVAANSYTNISATALGMSTPTGYSPLAICSFRASTHLVYLARVLPTTTGSNTVAVVHNTTNAERSVTVNIDVVYVKSIFIK